MRPPFDALHDAVVRGSAANDHLVPLPTDVALAGCVRGPDMRTAPVPRSRKIGPTISRLTRENALNQVTSGMPRTPPCGRNAPLRGRAPLRVAVLFGAQAEADRERVRHTDLAVRFNPRARG